MITGICNLRGLGIQIIPTVGPKVCKYYLHWAIWIPRVRSRQGMRWLVLRVVPALVSGGRQLLCLDPDPRVRRMMPFLGVPRGLLIILLSWYFTGLIGLLRYIKLNRRVLLAGPRLRSV